jgi:hypothetical protein
MSKKYVMIPWERFQSLTALEKNDFNTPHYSTGGAAVKASNEHSLDEEPERAVDHTTGGAAVQALQLQQQPAETTAAVVSRSGEGAAAAVLEQEEQEEGEKSVEDISLLKPPGVPAKRWLTWN